MVTPFCGDFIYIFFVEVDLIDADFRKLELGVSESYEGHCNCADVFVKSFVFLERSFRLLDNVC
jgi:hypothetical protein